MHFYSEHAEALLECYDLLQRLHEKGLIDLLNGLLSASDTVTVEALRILTDSTGRGSANRPAVGLRGAISLSEHQRQW
jgi:uncharacterized protein YjgD (DUF1641 family)